jgi:flagellar basal-body rod modification protein FlgD
MGNAQSVSNQITASGTDSSSSDSATISANDFLTLLVTEMQNQDPTADTDPNEYINQLVQVNSLEQLISINQTLTTDSTPATTGGAVKTPGAPQVISGVNEVQPNAAGVSPISAAQQSSSAYALDAPIPRFAEGNLTIPAALPAAQRVAESLTVAR